MTFANQPIHLGSFALLSVDEFFALQKAKAARQTHGVINCIEAEGSIPAEAEAKRLFAAGQFNPTVIAQAEGKR